MRALLSLELPVGGRVTNETIGADPNGLNGSLTYTYDSAGNVTSVLSSNANGTSVNYSWDANNRLSSVTDNRTGGTTNYVYDPTNQLSWQSPHSSVFCFKAAQR